MMTYRTANAFFLSPSLHHIHQRKRTRLANVSRSSSTTAFPRLPLPSIHSSSQTSMNRPLKEVDLSEGDFCQLKKALQTLFACTRTPQKRCDWQQRLTSPYLQSRSNNHNRFSSPLYTDEHFIRKGLWNHNDGPEIHDIHIQQGNLCYQRHPHLNRCAPASILRTPLTLVPNQKHLLTAMTSNFTVEVRRRSQSALEVRSIKDGKREGDEEPTETNSTRIRRKKVQAWERENLLQHSQSMTSSTVGQSLTKKSVQFTHKSHTSSAIGTPTVAKVASTDQNIDHLFPMVKVLAPYIILRDVMYSKSRVDPMMIATSKSADRSNQQRSAHNEKGFIKATEKRPCSDMAHTASVSAKRRSLLLPGSHNANCTGAMETSSRKQQQQQKKNYLLAEFESILTRISKDTFI